MNGIAYRLLILTYIFISVPQEEEKEIIAFEKKLSMEYETKKNRTTELAICNISG